MYIYTAWPPVARRRSRGGRKERQWELAAKAKRAKRKRNKHKQQKSERRNWNLWTSGHACVCVTVSLRRNRTGFRISSSSRGSSVRKGPPLSYKSTQLFYISMYNCSASPQTRRTRMLPPRPSLLSSLSVSSSAAAWTPALPLPPLTVAMALYSQSHDT